MTSPQPPSPSWPPTAGGPGAQPPVSGAPYGSPVSGAPAGAGAAPAGRPGRGVARLAMFVAAIAVLLAVSSLGVAAWALSKADKAADAVAALPPPPGPPPGADATPQPGPTPSEAGTEAATAEPDPADPTESNRPLDPQAVFDLKYEKRTLRVQAPTFCCDVRGVDLDEPRVSPPNGGDIGIKASDTPKVPNLTFADGVSAATTESASTPNQCAEKIQFAPLVTGEAYPLRKGDVYCILTSQAAADSTGISQKMVVVSITGIGADSVVTMQSTAFDVPK